MRNLRAASTLAFIAVGLLSAACSPGGGTNGNSSATTNANTYASAHTANFNIEELGMLVTLPVEPDEAAWKETAAANQPKRLTAVLKYSPQAAARVAEQASRHRPPSVETVSTEPWYPAELIAQSETSGESTIRGQSYAANEFFHPPYSDGKLTRIENTDFFILELYAR